MTMSQRSAEILGFILSVLLIGVPSEAQIYKWTDSSGTVHFSDNPPPGSKDGTKVEVLQKLPTRPVPTPSPSEEPTAEPAAEAPPPPAEGSQVTDDYAPEEGGTGSEVTVTDNTGDRAVWRRATSPENRPGQPMRQIPQVPRRR